MIRRLQDALARDPATVGLYLFALAAFSQRALAVLGCLLMLYALWRERAVAWPRLRRSPLFLSTAALATWTLLRTALATLEAPQHAELHVKDAARILYLCGFVAVAWALRADHQRILRFFALAALGFILARLWHVDWQFDYPKPWWQMRLGLGLETIGMGYYAGTLLLGLLIYAPRILARARRPLVLAGATLLLTALAAASLQWVILSQSRAAWLALLPLLAVATLFVAHHAWRRGGVGALGLLGAPLCLLALLLAFNAPTLLERLSQERHTIEYLLDGNLDAISSADERGWKHSLGTRITMLEAGYRHWLEAPLAGKGPAATKLTLRASDDRVLPQYNDYHNVPLDMLVRFGVIGLLLLLLCVTYTVSAARQAWRSGALPADTLLFLACALCLILASSLSNFRLLNFDFRYWLFIVSAPMTTFALLRGRAAGTPADRKTPRLAL